MSLDDAILFVEYDHFGLEAREFLRIEQSISGDNHTVAFVEKSRRGTVDDNFPLAWLAFDEIRLDALAVVHVPDRDLFPGDDVAQLHQPAIDADAADVVEIRARDHGVMNLRFADEA